MTDRYAVTNCFEEMSSESKIQTVRHLIKNGQFKWNDIDAKICEYNIMFQYVELAIYSKV